MRLLKLASERSGLILETTLFLKALKSGAQSGVHVSLLSSQEVNTFGFRGEALSSLCALAAISITTRTANTNPAQRLTYDQAGCLVGTVPTARAVGTTVAVKDLFKTLPVRHKVQKGALKRCT